MKPKHLITTFVTAMFVSSASLAAGPNGPNPTEGPVPATPGGTTLGSAQLFAVVSPSGTTLRGGGNLSSKKLSTGTYQVLFTRDISACGWSGTIGFGSFSGTVPASTISVTGRVGTTPPFIGVFVQTFNLQGVPTDEPFLITVIC